MKKDMFKGMAVGVCATLAVGIAIPLAAQTAQDALGFNLFRINSGNSTVADWGVPRTLEDGREVPNSITYEGEDYIHADTAAEAFGGSNLWNGDSATYTFLETGIQGEYELVTEVEKPDAQGNMWKYQVRRYDGAPNHSGFNYVEANRYYIVVADETRGYARAYDLLGPNSYEFADDCVYIARPKRIAQVGPDQGAVIFTKLVFANTTDNQDGIELFMHPAEYRFSYPYVINGIAYYFGGTHMRNSPANGWSSIGILYAFNYETAQFSGWYKLGGNLSASPYKSIDSVKDGYIMYQNYNSIDTSVKYSRAFITADESPEYFTETKYYEILNAE